MRIQLLSNQSSTIVQRLWNYCNVLRDDGLSYADYLEQLTYFLFLKMDDERVRELGQSSAIPEGYNWASLTRLDGDTLETHYRNTLIELGKGSGLIPVIFRKAQNKSEDQGKRLVNGVTLLLAGPACNRQPVLTSIALQLQRQTAVARLLSLLHVHW